CVSLVCVSLVCVNKVHSQTLQLQSSDLNVLTGSERAQFWKAHNDARTAVGVDPVDWSEELSQHALDSLARQKDALIEKAKEGWAKGLAVLPAHQADSEYGENVAGWAGSRPIAAPWAVESWLTEKAAFDKLNAMAPYRVGDEIGKTETDARGNERPIIVGHY